jgi:hypothetical protein
MNEERYRELIAKRDGPGLSDAEAAELGRMEAEREGKPYGDATHPTDDVRAERDEEDREAGRTGRRRREDVDETPMSPERDEADRYDLPPPG